MSGAGTAKPTLLIDNDRVRVIRWEFARRGDNTGWHRHDCDYVVVPLLDGRLRISEGGGKLAHPRMRAGEPYYRRKGVEHDVANDNEGAYAFVEIELKQ